MNAGRKLTGKRALVTGAGTGIGREIGLEFARQGAAVAFHYGRSADGALSAVREARDAGVRAEAFQADFNQVEEVRKLARAAEEFLGGVDVLVNNAGITFNRVFENVTPEQFDTLFHVNIRAQFFLTQALLPALLASRGAIVNMTSVHALLGRQGHSVYAGTKGAIVAYTRELAVELAPRGVRVNALAPGAVPVDSHRELFGAEAANEIGKGIPCGFAGTPLDIAKVAAFLASDDARYIVGQTIIADGGTSAWMSFDQGFKDLWEAPFGRGYVPGV
ncbi:MAG: SDR family oxidoreductase [Kiritimatiellae bacterium]|nr:SDR family oxidoreductase [Kiritimatiellia bacterium]